MEKRLTNFDGNERSSEQPSELSPFPVAPQIRRRKKQDPKHTLSCDSGTCSDSHCSRCSSSSKARPNNIHEICAGESDELRLKRNEYVKHVEHWYDSVKSSLDSSTEYFHEDEYEREFDNMRRAGYKGNLEARVKKSDKRDMLRQLSISSSGSQRRERLQSDSDIVTDKPQLLEQPTARSARNSASDDYVGRTVKKQTTHDLIDTKKQQHKKTGKEKVRFVDMTLEDDAFIADTRKGFDQNYPLHEAKRDKVDDSLSELSAAPMPKFVDESREIHV